MDRFHSRDQIKKGTRVWWSTNEVRPEFRSYFTGTVTDPGPTGQKVKIKKDVGGYAKRFPCQLLPVSENRDPLLGNKLFPDMLPLQLNGGKTVKPHEKL